VMVSFLPGSTWNKDTLRINISQMQVVQPADKSQ
jgi:hypothetical protein